MGTPLSHASMSRSVSYRGDIKTAGVKSWAPFINATNAPRVDHFNPRFHPETHHVL